MVQVKELQTKINGSWVPLLPNATTSSKGIVQVGSGLSVSNGVISTTVKPISYIVSPASTTFQTIYGVFIPLITLPPNYTCSGTIRIGCDTSSSGSASVILIFISNGIISLINKSIARDTTEDFTIPSNTNTVSIYSGTINRLIIYNIVMTLVS